MPEFRALVDEVEAFGPSARAIASSTTPQTNLEYYRQFDISRFSKQLEALLDLLDSTADALAAEWDMRQEALIAADDVSKPTVH